MEQGGGEGGLNLGDGSKHGKKETVSGDITEGRIDRMWSEVGCEEQG